MDGSRNILPVRCLILVSYFIKELNKFEFSRRGEGEGVPHFPLHLRMSRYELDRVDRRGTRIKSDRARS